MRNFQKESEKKRDFQRERERDKKRDFQRERREKRE